ncbi:SHOCT domain-containing protein [Pseudorhodobacter turbinis]
MAALAHTQTTVHCRFLKERFAKGEIDIEEFTARKKALLN